jgi:chloramphenicol 3-O-phosphotransferase
MRREREGGDRYPGEGFEHLAEGVHEHVIYDFEIDTSRHSREEAARRVVAAWEKRNRPSACERMLPRSR